MGLLTNQYVSESYQGLLNLANPNTGLTTTLQSVTDGLGGTSPLQMSRTQINISGSLTINGSPVAATDTGSLMKTGSVAGNTLTFTKGDGSTFNLQVDTGSVPSGTISGSQQIAALGYATTGSVDALTGSINSLNAATSSYVTETESGSFMITGSVAGDTLTFTKGDGSQFSLQVSVATGSLPAGVVSGSQQIIDLGFLETSSFNSYTSSNDSKVNSLIASTGSYATTSSLTSLSQSIATTDLSQNNRLTALEGVTGSINRNGLITTGSIGGTQSITGSLNVEGTISATSASFTYVNTVYETASVIYSSGSNQLGDAEDDTQTLWGAVKLPSGSLSITGSLRSTGEIRTDGSVVVGTTLLVNNIENPAGSGDITINTSPFFKVAIDGDTEVTGTLKVTGGITGSLQGTASYATQALSASYAPTVLPNGVVSGSQQIVDLGFATTGSVNQKLDTGSFNTYTASMDARTGSYITTGSAASSQSITGSLILSGSAGPELDVKGDQTNTGSLTVRSGSISSISNNTTLNIDSYLTNSLGGQANIIRGWSDNPSGGGAGAVQSNYTGSLRITGSNNIVTLPQIRATGVGGGTDMEGYISGSGNILSTNLSTIYLNTGSLLFPKTNNNNLGSAANIYMRFTTSSLAGGHPLIQNNTINGGNIDIVSDSGSINVNNNTINGGGITTTQNFLTNARANVSVNTLNGGTVTLNHISSSINYTSNISNSPITINNHLSSSIVLNTLTFTNNTVFGGSSNTGVGVWVSGSQASNTTRTISDNLIGGRSSIVSSSFVGSNNSNLISSLIYGQNLIVSGNHASTGGSTFVGRFNDTGSLNRAQDIVFAVGTGTAAATRRTGFWITSGSLVNVSGSLIVSGGLDVSGGITGAFAIPNFVITTGSIAGTQNITGSLKISGSNPLQVGPSSNVGRISTLGGQNWLYRSTDDYNTVVGNVQGLNAGFFAGSEKNMVLNGFFSPFATGSNNVIIQGAGDDFISGSGNIFIGSHNSHAGGNNSILLGSTSYPSGSIFDNKFELGTQASSRIFHKQGTDPLQIGDDTQVTGSLQVSNLATSTGSFVVTTDNNGTLTKAPYSGITSNLFNAAQYSTLQTLSGSANVSQSIYFDTTGPQFGVSLVDNTKLTVANPGTYNIQFSAQLEADGGADNVFIWFKKNGTNIAGSASEVELDNNKENIMTVNILDTAVANDYYEIAWQNANNNGRLLYQAASGNVPSTPSVIATITQVR
jgi:hypothetical protein